MDIINFGSNSSLMNTIPILKCNMICFSLKWWLTHKNEKSASV